MIIWMSRVPWMMVLLLVIEWCSNWRKKMEMINPVGGSCALNSSSSIYNNPVQNSWDGKEILMKFHWPIIKNKYIFVPSQNQTLNINQYAHNNFFLSTPITLRCRYSLHLASFQSTVSLSAWNIPSVSFAQFILLYTQVFKNSLGPRFNTL